MKTNDFNFISWKSRYLLLIVVLLVSTACLEQLKEVSEYDPSKFKERNIRQWQEFNKQYDNKWNIVWNENSGTPHRISGFYIEYDQKITKDNLKDISNKFLKDHQKLLQIEPDQMKLSKINIEERGSDRIGNAFVYYDQMYRGIPVYSGSVRFLFHGQKLSIVSSDYFPGIHTKVSPKLNEKQVREIAMKTAAAKDAVSPEKIRLMIYPKSVESKIRYHLAYEVTMPVIKVPGQSVNDNLDRDEKDILVPVKWRFFIEANKGIILERINLIRSEELSGRVKAMIHPALPTDVQIEVSLGDMNVLITQGAGSQTTATDDTGYYIFPGLASGNIDVEAHLKGPHVKVHNSETADPDATFHTTTSPSVLDWNWDSYDPSPNNVESNAFYHVDLIRKWYLRGGPFDITPVSPAGPSQDYIDVFVRESYCNAYASIGSGRIMFGDDSSCEDFALCADIIYHEYTHLVIQQIFDDAGVNIFSLEHGDAFHEGFADYFGVSITGNPHQGSGCTSGRHVDTPDLRYPENYRGDSHSDGIIISGAVWDVRDLLGAGYTDNLAIRALKHTPATFSEYLGAMLEEDDNTAYSSDAAANDFPGDGTPNIDTICQSFYDKHGIYHSYCEGNTGLPVAILTVPSALNTEPDFFDNSISQIQIMGTALGSNAGNLQQYTIEYMSADAVGTWSSDAISLTDGGINPINSNILGTWDISAVANGFYLIKMDVTDNAGQTNEAIARVYVDKDIMSGWPKETNRYFPSAPVAADIDPEFPGKEIIARERWGSLFAYHLDGSMVPGWPRSVFHWPSWVPPAVADMNADGFPDVVAAGGSTLNGYMHTGAALPGWPITLSQDINNFYSMAIADIDRDRFLEVVLAIEAGTIYVYNHDGSLANGWPVNAGSDIGVDVAVADIDTLVGGLEIVVFNKQGELKVFHADGSLMSNWPQTTSVNPKVSPVIADLDGDKDLDIIVESESQIYAFKPDGTPVSNWPVSSGFSLNRKTGIVVADVDKDGSVEVILKGTGIIGIWNSDGTTYTGAPFVIPGTGSGYHKNAAPVVGDINLDGNYNLLDGYYFNDFGDSATYGEITLHRIYALDNNGHILGNWPRYLPGSYTPSMPVINDVDNDGQLELFAACFGVYVWDLAGSSLGEQFAEWGDYREDSWRRAFYSNLPDLKIKSHSVNWTGSSKEVTIEVINQGRGDAGQFLVYLDAQESSSFADPILAQRSFTLNSLNSGESQNLLADFSPLANAGNNFLIDVGTIIIHTDSKGMVEEDKEGNNLLFIPIP